MQQAIRTILLCQLTLAPVLLFAAEEDWELRRDRDGIQVYTRDVSDSPYDEVRSETIINGSSLSAMVALIEDAEACPDWADRCAESYVVERIAPHESYIYTHNDMPFPVRDRDVVAHVIWTQDRDSLTVTMTSRAVADKLPEIDGRLRLTEASASWRFEPLPDGDVKISNEAHINPGSRLPGWVTNMLLVDTPFETMKSFIAEIQKPRYRNAEVSFIENP